MMTVLWYCPGLVPPSLAAVVWVELRWTLKKIVHLLLRLQFVQIAGPLHEDEVRNEEPVQGDDHAQKGGYEPKTSTSGVFRTAGEAMLYSCIAD